MAQVYDYRTYADIFGAIYRQDYTKNPDYMSFEGWRQRCRQTREKLLERRAKDAEVRIGELMAKVPKAVNQHKGAVDSGVHTTKTDVIEQAGRHGVMFPSIAGDDDYAEAVETVQGWRRIAAEDCARDDSGMGYFSRLFWYEGGNGGQFGAAAEMLDNPNFLRVSDGDLAQVVRKEADGGSGEGENA